MLCHLTSETHWAEKYQLGDKKETTGQAVVKTVNPKVRLLQKKEARPCFGEAESEVLLLFPGLDTDTDQVSIALSGGNHFGDDHQKTRGNKA